jgi:hypothetical protein
LRLQPVACFPYLGPPRCCSPPFSLCPSFSFQAILEFHCFAPPLLPGAGRAAALRAFAAFWRSGAPRIGEPGAQGWATWAQQEAFGHAPGGSGGARGPSPPPPLPREPPPPLPREPPPSAEASGGAAAPSQPEAREPGGWGGWFEVEHAAAAEAAMRGVTLGGGASGDAHGGSAAEIGPPRPPGAGAAVDAGAPAAALGGSPQEDEEDEEAGSEEAPERAAEEASAGGGGEAEEAEGEEGQGAAAEVDELELMLQMGIKMEERLDEMQAEGITPEIMER